MKWENLKNNKCPHCDAKLEESLVEFTFNCTECRFSIDISKKMSIEAHRGHPEKEGNIVKLKWQRLREERCPVCSNNLSYGNGAYDILVCTTPDCLFKIRYDRYSEILQDVTHPCNQFYERERLQKYGIDEE